MNEQRIISPVWREWAQTHTRWLALAEGEPIPADVRPLGKEEIYRPGDVDAVNRRVLGGDGVWRRLVIVVARDAPPCPGVPPGYVDPATLPAPEGYVLPPRMTGQWTGYRGGGYGWRSLEAGTIRPATMRDHIDGRTVTRAEAEARLQGQSEKSARNADAFHDYMRS